jgi:hypothetical protein
MWRYGEGRHTKAWERFMKTQRRELEKRLSGHLAWLLGAALPGESAEELQKLAREDQRMAEEGLVALRKPNEELFYKHIDDLTKEDRPARIEAEKARAAWLRARTRERRT